MTLTTPHPREAPHPGTPLRPSESPRLRESPWPRSEPAALSPGPEQTELRDSLRGLLAKYADIGSVRESATSDAGYSDGLWRRLVDDMSVAALAVPESDDGLGYGAVELGVILEECGRALVCEPVLASAVVGTQALLLGSSGDGIEEVLAAAMTGSVIVTVAVDSTGPDAPRADMVDGHWIVQGTATHIVAGDAADVVVVSANCVDGRRAFVVRPGDSPRVAHPVVDPTRRQASITFDDLPATVLVEPDRHEAFRSRIDDLTTLALACENTGVIERLLEMTLDHLMTREQFGRQIGSFQAIKHRAADLLIAHERARSASRYAAAVYAEDPDDARLPVAVAGAVCTDAVLEVAAEAIQLHGGVGFTWEHPAHSYFRRALGNEALQGDSRSHRARIAALIDI